MLNSFLKYLSYEKRYSPHTVSSYKTDLEQFEAFLISGSHGNSLKDADHNTVRSWMVHLSESGLNNRSINRKQASLRTFYKFLLKRSEIGSDPMTYIKSLKFSKNLPEFVQEQDMIRILDHVEFTDDFSGKRDQLIMALLYGTGIRLAELISLKVQDINWNQQSIKVLGKRNKERVIPFPDSLVKVIRDYLKVREQYDNTSGYLIVTDKGSITYPMLIYRTVNKYLSLFITLDKRSPHILRHTYATHLLNKGADLNAVKDLLGHANLAATQVYTHNSIEKLKKVFDQAHPKA